MATLAFSLEGLRVKAINAAGAVMPGAKLYTYAAGGLVTPLATYSDVALTAAHANPVVADAGGLFPQIFLSNTAAYAFDLQTSAGVSYETLDNVYSPGYLAFNAVQGPIAAMCQGRLTLSSGVAIPTTDITAATSVYFTPYLAETIGLFDGTIWQPIVFAEKTLSIAGFAASTPFDVWGRISGGALAIDSTAWANDTARATGLARQNGVLVKSGDTTRRYLGTFRTTTVAGQSEDSLSKRFCWNYYNRVRRPLQRIESTANWNYTTATIRQANGSVANQVALVCGFSEDSVSIETSSAASNTAGGIFVDVGIGLDVTNAMATGSITGDAAIDAAGGHVTARASLELIPAVGYHFYAMLERSTAAGVTTWYGAGNGAGNVTTMIGVWRG